MRVGTSHYRTFDVGGQFVNKDQLHLMDLLKKLDIDLCEADSSGKIICDFTQRKFCTTTGSIIGAYGLRAKYELTQFFAKVIAEYNR